MAGHSHSANIAHRKGRVDKQRGKLFGKLSRAIIVAAQRGGARPDREHDARASPSRRPASSSMPKDNIERAIKTRRAARSTGKASQELVYEGYGPAGVAVICDILTDNRNRTAGEIRKIFEVHGGNLGATDCVAWMFERKGVFVVPHGKATEEQLFELAIEAGADDVQAQGEQFEITCPPDAYQAVSAALEGAGHRDDRLRVDPHPVEYGGAVRGRRPPRAQADRRARGQRGRAVGDGELQHPGGGTGSDPGGGGVTGGQRSQ